MALGGFFAAADRHYRFAVRQRFAAALAPTHMHPPDRKLMTFDVLESAIPINGQAVSAGMERQEGDVNVVTSLSGYLMRINVSRRELAYS